MLPKKFLVGGVATVGSVATAAVVTNGLPSTFASKVTEPQEETSNRTKEQSGAISEAKTAELREAEERARNIARNAEETNRQDKEKEESRKKVKGWLDSNKGSNNWQIKVKYGSEIKDFTVGNPTLLPTYLNRKTDLLKSIAGTDTIFIFDSNVSNDRQNWKNIFNEKQILEWVKKTSGDKATLQVENLSKLDEGELEKLFNSLSSTDNKNLFTTLEGTAGDKKTILFEKIENNWKHSKTEIKKWLSDSNQENLEFKIQESNSKETTIEQSKENDLAGLLSYLKTNKSDLLKYKNPTGTEKTVLTLKKDSAWDIVYSEQIINNWVSNTSGKKATLDLREGETKKELSGFNNNQTEFKQLLIDLKKEEKLFSEMKNEKTIVFEKYKKNDGDSGSWTHIKKAIENWTSEGEGVDVSLPKIQVGGSWEEITDDKVEDSELIGLLKHIRDHEGSSKEDQKYENVTDGSLGFKKDSKEGKWQGFDIHRPKQNIELTEG